MIKKLSALAFALFCLLSLTGAQWFPLFQSPPPGGWCSLIPQSGLVNCWPFDTANTTSGTATDVIGGKNVTLTSITLNGSGPSSNLNNAGVFNGTTSKGTTSLANIPAAAFSIVVWINTATTAGGRILDNDNTFDATNNGFQILANTGNNIFKLGNGTTSNQFGTGGISASTWTMLTFTFDGMNVKIYVGATLVGTTAFTGPVTNGTTNVAFGFLQSGNANFYNGMMAGVAFYNRALTNGEVTTNNGL